MTATAEFVVPVKQPLVSILSEDAEDWLCHVQEHTQINTDDGTLNFSFCRFITGECGTQGLP